MARSASPTAGTGSRIPPSRGCPRSPPHPGTGDTSRGGARSRRSRAPATTSCCSRVIRYPRTITSSRRRLHRVQHERGDRPPVPQRWRRHAAVQPSSTAAGYTPMPASPTNANRRAPRAVARGAIGLQADRPDALPSCRTRCRTRNTGARPTAKPAAAARTRSTGPRPLRRRRDRRLEQRQDRARGARQHRQPPGRRGPPRRACGGRPAPAGRPSRRTERRRGPTMAASEPLYASPRLRPPREEGRMPNRGTADLVVVGAGTIGGWALGVRP